MDQNPANITRRACLRRIGRLTAAIAAISQMPARAQEPPRSGADVWNYLASLPKDKRLEVLAREAKREGQVVIYGAVGIDRANLMIKLFNEKYAEVKVDFVRMTEAQVVEKVSIEHRTGRIVHDMALSAAQWMPMLGEYLAPYEPTSWDEFDPRFKVGSRQAGWTAIVYEVLPSTIAWRTDRIKKEDVPKTLFELADPKWKGRTGVTNNLENAINSFIGLLGEDKGMELVRKLAALDNRLYSSVAAVAQGLASGEIDLAWELSAPRPVGLKLMGAPIDFVFQDPLLGFPTTLSVVSGAKNPYSAALFMDYLTQRDAQERLDKAEGGRFFGHTAGRFSNNLANYPQLTISKPISAARVKELNMLVQDLFIRR